MQCRNCKEFKTCGYIMKIKRDLNLQDFLKEVGSNDTCLDFNEADNTRDREELKLFKNGREV